ncbi:gametocyte-specific factor 1 [Harpegnathos saltator]|uniref:Gametocyte-specific factor 1 n=1 Tax=Harpegnathos saltator TaxID=610380 RepID=E2C5F0_HARSA|nr:gametocyte-specific factor 1 [Harpegnathos saltator]EFN76763.1 Gametocyte-specific factor 1 [Harpegnathos saltator]
MYKLPNLNDNDKVVQCPFNKNHIVFNSRIQRHIVKCEKNYDSNYRVMCPFNATHRLSKSEIAEHIETCSSRKIVEANHIEQQSEPALSTWKTKSNMTTSTLDDSWEGQIEESISRPAYMDQNDESIRDDMSVVSSLGIGRGRIMARLNYVEKLKSFRKDYRSS